jgi:hypothetical protein
MVRNITLIRKTQLGFLLGKSSGFPLKYWQFKPELNVAC